MTPPRDMVRLGYDRIADAYLAERARFHSQMYLDRLAALFAPGARVLDVGCGAGIPTDRMLIDRGFRVIGLDVSPRQIERARKWVPEAIYVVRDSGATTTRRQTKRSSVLPGSTSSRAS